MKSLWRPSPERLKAALDGFIDDRRWAERVKNDPIEFPHRYREPRDIEVAALLSSALAYGRVDLFKPKIDGLLGKMGVSPADYVTSLTVAGAARDLHGFVYRFNVPADISVLLLGMGAVIRAQGSLENAFVSTRGAPWPERLALFSEGLLKAVPRAPIVKRLGPERGLSHLLPHARGGVSKRLNLFLRWMVRGPDEIDFGIWKRVSASELMMPVDTHIARLGQWLGLTRQKTISWKMVEEITTSLRALDPTDPIRYDFALCHYGMSGACPIVPVATNCARCALRGECTVGSKKRKKAARTA